LERAFFRKPEKSDYLSPHLFTALRAIARPDAVFCFSTESLDSPGYQLRSTGRFAYSRDYILKIAAATAWTVLTEEKTKLRKERERWIDGDLWVFHSLSYQ
jgi:predicted TPR repeat methyltransferase